MKNKNFGGDQAVLLADKVIRNDYAIADNNFSFFSRYLALLISMQSAIISKYNPVHDKLCIHLHGYIEELSSYVMMGR